MIFFGLGTLHLLLSGQLFPKHIVEKLRNPHPVVKITKKGFIISDGRLIKVRYVSELPINSNILQAAVKNGIEVDEYGNTFGLLKIWHWCGNDPVRYHIARVNLTNLILASGGKPDPDIPQDILKKLIPEHWELHYGEHGLNISDFLRIRCISNSIGIQQFSEGDTLKTESDE